VFFTLTHAAGSIWWGSKPSGVRSARFVRSVLYLHWCRDSTI